MSTVERRHSPVYRQLEAYEESWKRDHDAVRECWAWEDTVAVGIATAALIERVDRVWRDRVFRGVEEYCEDANDFYRALFALWLRVTGEVLAQVGRLEEQFGSVEGATELRQAETRLRAHLSQWQPPRLSAAVGLREMTLPAEAAAELDRVLEEAKRLPPEPSRPRMQQMSAAELKQRSRR
jgi:hypothetical protein